jgi:hypothetical protein
MSVPYKNLVLTSATGVLILAISSCGSKETSEHKDEAPCVTSSPSPDGGYTYCTGTAVEASFNLVGGGGQEYVVAPFVLGDHTEVKGAAGVNYDFELTATSASLAKMKSLRPTSGLTGMAFESSESLMLDRKNQAKVFLNRFDPTNASSSALSGFNGPFRQMLGFENLNAAKTLIDNTSCPTTTPSVTGSTLTIASSKLGNGFCVAYADDPTADTKANIEGAVQSVLSSYKDTIYKDPMTSNTKDGYAFNPLIVFVNSLVVGGVTIDGAFALGLTTSQKRPVLHVSAGITKELLYATIAHEMQHAIVDYYKRRGANLIEETISVDEGIAHLMEDAFGYGEANYNSYVKNFLAGFVDGSPVLVDSDAANAAAARGGANSFVYYLAHRAGGFTVTNGKPFSGLGMDAIVSLVKQTNKNGPAALTAAFGKDNLVHRFGDFVGTVYSDNRSFSFAPEAFASRSYDGITNLLGETGKTFGLRFSNFRGGPTIAANGLGDATGGFSIRPFETFPVLVKPTGLTSQVTLKLPQQPNVGISVVRVK